MNFLTDEELKEREEKLKRKTPADDKQTLGESRVTKRRCMDGSLLVERVIGAFMPIEFANNLFETELHVAVSVVLCSCRKNAECLIRNLPYKPCDRIISSVIIPSKSLISLF